MMHRSVLFFPSPGLHSVLNSLLDLLMRACNGSDDVTVAAFFAATHVCAERRRTRHGSDSNTAGTLDGFSAIVGIIGQTDNSPGVLFAPVVKVLPPHDTY